QIAQRPVDITSLFNLTLLLRFRLLVDLYHLHIWQFLLFWGVWRPVERSKSFGIKLFGIGPVLHASMFVALLSKVARHFCSRALISQLPQAFEFGVVVSGILQVGHEQGDTLERLDNLVNIIVLRLGCGVEGSAVYMDGRGL